MSRNSLKVKCCDCGKEFELTSGEVSWYLNRKWALPKRCAACRELKKKKYAKN